MIFVLACLLVLWFSLSRSPFRARLSAIASDSDRLQQMMKRAAAGFFVLSAGVVLLRGNVEAALLLLGGGLWLFNLARTTQPREPVQSRPTGPSRVRSAMIEMDFDPATGAMQGMVLAGAEEGRPLDTLSRARCDAVYMQCCQADQAGARLLEAYFDRRFPGWRQARQRDGDARRDGARHANRMSQKEAHEVLGLASGATRDEIVRTHRALMKKLHPDQGGSTDLAARVNEAKEVLMRRHL